MTAGDPWSAWDLAEAFQLACAADFVVASGLLDERARSIDALAAEASVDARLLAPLLHLLASRTDLVDRCPEGFRKGPGLGPIEEATLHQYVGAYGPNASALPEILASPGRGRDLVDRDRHARAFARAPGPAAVLLPRLLEQLELGRVLDLGCGTGELLVTMAGRDPDFRGWGVDANPTMIRIAEERLDAGGTAPDQVRFYVADVGEPACCVPDSVLRDVGTIVAASLVNEFFHPDETTAVRWLGALRAALPDRVLVVVDYYGALGIVADPPPRTALHDWIQVISSQGVPPPDLHSWESVYVAAQCSLLHAVEDPDAGVFIHFVRLSPPGQL
ncbi:MAG: hypothetical protein QOI99_581 [Actinomycetota bacterium]|nr:hypothetical protein [Actinomycetota bacterium]